MKIMNKLVYSLLASLLVLTACFEDEGNYDYREMNPPRWLVDNTQPSRYYAYQGYDVTLDGKGLFTWDTDSLTRAENVTYEWILNGKPVAEGLQVTMSTYELMEKAGVTECSGAMGTFGTFNIVEKNTGVKYMANILVWFNPKYSEGNWVLLVDDNGKARVSVVREYSKSENGQLVSEYDLVQDAYAESNDGSSIPGKPLTMNWAYDRHVGQNGSITVITDEGGFQLDAEDMSLYGKIEGDEFLDGTPANFQLVARADYDATENRQPATFLATADGQLYCRLMSGNYLGGKYLTEPYFVDEKGYKVTKFWNTNYNEMIPCYDEKNRRVMIASVEMTQVGEDYTSVFRPIIVPLSGTPAYGAPVNCFPEGTEILYIGPHRYYPSLLGSNMVFVCLYNEPGVATTQLRHFAVFMKGLGLNTGAFHFGYADMPIPELLDSSSCILSSGSNRTPATCKVVARTIFFTKGNEVRYFLYDGSGLSIGVKYRTMPLTEVTSPITSISLAVYNCDQLFVGCENGDVLVYDITSYDFPRLLYKGNVGGKVLNVRQLGLRSPGCDSFNN